MDVTIAKVLIATKKGLVFRCLLLEIANSPRTIVGITKKYTNNETRDDTRLQSAMFLALDSSSLIVREKRIIDPIDRASPAKRLVISNTDMLPDV